MKCCEHCKFAPEIKSDWSWSLEEKKRVMVFYAACPHGCYFGGVSRSVSGAGDLWDKLMGEVKERRVKDDFREREMNRWSIANGYRYWHITGPDKWEFDLCLKSKADLITEDMRAIYAGQGYDRIEVSDFVFVDQTDKLKV